MKTTFILFGSMGVVKEKDNYDGEYIPDPDTKTITTAPYYFEVEKGCIRQGSLVTNVTKIVTCEGSGSNTIVVSAGYGPGRQLFRSLPANPVETNMYVMELLSSNIDPLFFAALSEEMVEYHNKVLKDRWFRQLEAF